MLSAPRFNNSDSKYTYSSSLYTLRYKAIKLYPTKQPTSLQIKSNQIKSTLDIAPRVSARIIGALEGGAMWQGRGRKGAF